MRFFVNPLSFVFVMLGIAGGLSSCIPINQEEVLEFERIQASAPGTVDDQPGPTPAPVKTPPPAPPIAATYESINHHLIKKSCLSCHHARQTKNPSFATKDDLMIYAEDIVFYVEEGCDFGLCMPPRNFDDEPVKPVPTEEVLNSLKEWIANDYEDEGQNE